MKPKLLYPLFVITTALSAGLSLPTFGSEPANANQQSAELEQSTPAPQQLSTGIREVQAVDADLLQQIRERGKQQAAKAAFGLALWSLENDDRGKAAELLGEAAMLQPKNTDYLRAASRMAFDLKKYKAAEVYLINMLGIYRTAPNPVAIKLIGVFDDLATLYRVQGRRSASRSALIEGLAARTERYGEHDPRLVDNIYRLAEIELASANVGAAKGQLIRAIHILDDSPDSISDQDSAALLHNIGELFRVSRQYVEAESAYTKAMALWNSSPVHNPRGMAMTQKSLARLRAARNASSTVVNPDHEQHTEGAPALSSLVPESAQTQL